MFIYFFTATVVATGLRTRYLYFLSNELEFQII